MCRNCIGCLACQEHEIDWEAFDRQWEHEADDIEEELIERYEER